MPMPLAPAQADPEAMALAGKNKANRLAAPRFVSGFSGDEDLPSLSRFVVKPAAARTEDVSGLQGFVGELRE